MKFLITGLGNIGEEYQNTRHNIGFTILDALAKASNVVFADRRYGSVAEYSLKGQKIMLLKPSTFMNLSGNAVRYWLNQENIPIENLLVVVDDLALPLGTLRLRPQGSDAGHNGLKHIQSVLGTSQYARLRVGIGNDFPRGAQISYVLGTWSGKEWEALQPSISQAMEMIESFCLAGIQITMNRYNKR